MTAYQHRELTGLVQKALGSLPIVVLTGLSFLDKTPSARAGVLAYNGTSPVALGENLFAIPLGLLLS